MKTGTTFRSDDEYWAWVDKQIRLRERLWKAARYAALLGAGAFLMFLLMYFCVRNMGEGHYNHWQEALRSYRSRSG